MFISNDNQDIRKTKKKPIYSLLLLQRMYVYGKFILEDIFLIYAIFVFFLYQVPSSKLNQAYDRLKKGEDVVFVACTTNPELKYEAAIRKMTEKGDFVGEINCNGKFYIRLF